VSWRTWVRQDREDGPAQYKVNEDSSEMVIQHVLRYMLRLSNIDSTQDRVATESNVAASLTCGAQNFMAKAPMALLQKLADGQQYEL
jgi:hypothetical protein